MVGAGLRRGWLVLVAAVVVAVAGFSVYRLHGKFGSGHSTATPAGVAGEIVPFNPKDVLVEVFGEPGATASISYTDVHANPQHVPRATLPWSYAESTTSPAVITNVMAQGEGSTLGCRITIDGKVKTERIVNVAKAYAFCLDKSG